MAHWVLPLPRRCGHTASDRPGQEPTTKKTLWTPTLGRSRVPGQQHVLRPRRGRRAALAAADASAAAHAATVVALAVPVVVVVRTLVAQVGVRAFPCGVVRVPVVDDPLHRPGRRQRHASAYTAVIECDCSPSRFSGMEAGLPGRAGAHAQLPCHLP